MHVHLLTPASSNVLASKRYAALEPALMPMAIGYLGACLREAGHTVTARDQAATLRSNEATVAEAIGIPGEPILIGVSALTGAWRNTRLLAQEIRRRRPDAWIVMGNTHATVFAGAVLQDGLADFIVRGEGEHTIVELADALQRGGDPAGIQGLSWRDGATVRHNPDRPPIADLDEIPWPAWDLLDLSAWRYQRIPLVNLRTHPVPLMASRGCSHACTFCSQDKVVKRFRKRRISKVVDELDHHVRRHGFRSFGFNDSYFPWDHDTGLEFAERVRSHDWHQDTRWVTETRVDRIDDALMGALARSGLHAIFYGLETGNARMLDSLGKGTTLEQGREAVRIARRHGVLVIGFFMIGMPGETRDSIEDTLRYAIDIGVDIAKFAITVPYPGSKLFDALGRDQLDPEQCDQFTSWYDWTNQGDASLWSPEGFTPEEIVRLQRKLMLRFYARPRFVLSALRRGLFTPREMLMGGRLLLGRVG